MSKKIKLNYDQTYATQHSRDYYRGKSFHFSNKWVPGAHYVSDDYNVDFVVHGQSLLACAKSHLSTVDNEPTQYIYNSNGDICGVASTYWDFVIGSVSGASPGVKIIDNYWWICDNIVVPEEEQVWVNTGVKAKLELNDLTSEEIELLQQPGKEVVENFLTNVIVQTTGNNQDKLMSQDSVTKELKLNDLVTSEHLASLHKQIKNLEDNIDTLGNATAISLSLNEMLKINDAALIINGTTSPSSTPDFTGQFYNDTNAKLPYVALGNSSASNWSALATKASLDSYKNSMSSTISGINSSISSANQQISTNTNKISTEATRLEGLITSEANTRRINDSNLDDAIAQEASTRQQNDNVILNKIPEEATSTNKLADKAYVQSLVSDKVDKETGKGLSTEDFTTALKTKLSNLVEGAEINVQSDWNTADATADSYILNKPSLTGYFDYVFYDSTNHNIVFKNGGSSGTTLFTIDANDFIKDGMISNAEVKTVTSGINNGKTCLVITFNTDASKQDIEIPITDIFNASNYYTKTDSDAKFVAIVSGKGLSTKDYTETDQTKLSGIDTGAQVNVIEEIQIGGIAQTVTSKTVNLPAYPTTLPASDVSAWAKAANKPSYTFSEIGSTPTTLSGYGITDAKIESGTITLGSSSITPLTSHQNISGKADVANTVSTVSYDTTNKKIQKTINGTTTDVVTAATIVVDGGALTSHQDITGKADKTATVSTVSYNTTNKKIQKTINGTTTDVVTAATIVTDGGGLTSHQDISGKADKVTSAVNGNFAALDTNGNLLDSGHKPSDYLTAHQDISGKADKVISATANNFAGLDSNGNLIDSGKKASDFQVAGNYKTTQTAVSDPSASGTSITFISGISQTTNGVISPSKKTVRSASDLQSGLMSSSDYTKLSGIESGAQANVIESIQINGTTQTITSKTVNLPAYPTTLPASDVYSWAKQSTKPSYTFSELTSHPTTISGYGITDAHITNGVITIGSNTITPLTSFTETDPTVSSWAKASNKPSYTLDEVSDGSTRKLSNYKTISSLQSKGSTSLPIYFDASGDAQVITDLALDGSLSGNAFKTIAEHIAELTSRIEALENSLDKANNFIANSIDSANGYYINGDKTILTGTSAPTTTPNFVGQFYINTSGPALYYAVSNSSTSGWKQA